MLDKLAAMGELENTWIFYTADHGMALGRHGLQGKQNVYEHTWQVPFIVKGNEGKSFVPVLEGEQETVRDILHGVYCGGQKPGIRSVRRGDWKLVKYESPSGGLHMQLFNLKDNPREFVAEHHEPHYPIASAERHEKQHAAIEDPEERTYRANIAQLDDAFGMLMKTLDDSGATDSTLVFFTSDNGRRRKPGGNAPAPAG